MVRIKTRCSHSWVELPLQLQVWGFWPKAVWRKQVTNIGSILVEGLGGEF